MTVAAAVYEERPAGGALRPWSTCVWVRRAPDAGTTETRVVPDGSLDLLWRKDGLEIAGPDTGHRRVPLEPGELICGVRLRPGAARPLLGEVPATAVVDAQPALDLLWGSESRRLEDLVAAASGPWQAAERLAEALSARLRAHRPDPVAVAVAQALDRPRPAGINGLAWELGYSERQPPRLGRCRVRPEDSGADPDRLSDPRPINRFAVSASSWSAGRPAPDAMRSAKAV